IGENEVAVLQRKYRILEGDKQAYEKETQEEIRKQRELIQQAEKERADLFAKLKGPGSKYNESEELKLSATLKLLIEKGDNVEAQIEEEKKKQIELEKEIRETIRKMDKERKAAGPSEDPSKKIRRLMGRVVEGRLDESGKFNMSLIMNSKLREEIETMRGDKRKFLQLFKKLKKEIQETRKKGEKVVNEANEAYHNREEAQARIVRVHEQQGKDVEQFKAEMKEIQRELEHAEKLKMFLKEKAKEREPDEQFLKAKAKKEAEEQERKIEQKIKLNKYEEAIEKINEEGQPSEIDAELFFTVFMEREDLNFALFNYVTEQTSDIENLQDEIAQLKTAIELFQDKDFTINQEQETIMKDLEAKQKDAVMAQNKIKTDIAKLEKILEQLKAVVNDLSKKVGVDTSGFAQLLNWNEGVTDYNILTYLGSIEQRTNEVLVAYAYTKYK
uniref:ODAD1 central coiled coil region domain-containing protein n=1 Tax=Latimeria chalumnae TaxID=7897 RepID=H3AFN8_LATCH